MTGQRTAIIAWPRYAEISADRAWEKHRLDLLREVSAYLPENYAALATDAGIWIFGDDDGGGWSLDGYVIPRLASHTLRATETTVR